MDRTGYRQILDFAIQAEIEAHLFYQQVAETTQDAYLKQMFATFADEERKHRLILEGFRDNAEKALHFSRVTDYQVSEAMDDRPLTLDMRPADAIALAMKKEEAAMHQYLSMAQACDDGEQKRTFIELAEMERGHKVKLENAFVDIGFPEVW